MIIVIGHVVAREDTETQVQRRVVEHVLRSRSEPRCVSHEVSRDMQPPLGFVFVAHWSGMAALQAHFRMEASRRFAQARAELCEGSPQMAIYLAEAVRMG